MDKYAKLFKGLEMCAGPDCSTGCPYHGETKGGKTCRAWLLNDAAAALALEIGNAEGAEKECRCARVDGMLMKHMSDKKDEQLEELARKVNAFSAEAAYWHGQADALKWCLHDRFDGCTVEGCTDVAVDMELPETEATGHV